MSCKNVQQYLAVSEELPANLQSHFDSCADCQAFSHEVSRLEADALQLRESAPAGLRSQIRASMAPPRRTWNPVQFGVAAATVAVLALPVVAVIQMRAPHGVARKAAGQVAPNAYHVVVKEMATKDGASSLQTTSESWVTPKGSFVSHLSQGKNSKYITLKTNVMLSSTKAGTAKELVVTTDAKGQRLDAESVVRADGLAKVTKDDGVVSQVVLSGRDDDRKGQVTITTGDSVMDDNKAKLYLTVIDSPTTWNAKDLASELIDGATTETYAQGDTVSPDVAQSVRIHTFTAKDGATQLISQEDLYSNWPYVITLKKKDKAGQWATQSTYTYDYDKVELPKEARAIPGPDKGTKIEIGTVIKK